MSQSGNGQKQGGSGPLPSFSCNTNILQIPEQLFQQPMFLMY